MGALGIDALQSQRLLLSPPAHDHRHQRHKQQHGYRFGSSSFSVVEAAAAAPPSVVSVVAQGHGRGGRGKEGGGCGTSSLIHSSQVVRLPSASTSSPSPASASRNCGKCSFTPPMVAEARASSNWRYDTHCCVSSTRERHLRTTTAAHWLFVNAPSSSTPPRWGKGKLRAAPVIGNWVPSFSCCSNSSSSSDALDLDELLLVVARRWQPPSTKKGKVLLSVPTFSKTAPFQLGQRRGESENLVYKIQKVSASSIFSWLKNQQVGLLEIIPHSRLSMPNPHSWHWGSSCTLGRSLLRFATYSSSTSFAGVVKSIYLNDGAYGCQRMWAIRATSDYCSGGSSSIGSSSSSRAEVQAAASLEGSGALLAQQQQQQQQERRLHQRGSPDRERGRGREGEFLATGYGWRVRDAERGELRELIRLADIQADAFHERSPLFDGLFFKIFHAEVLSSLQYKARNFDPNRYSCLLAEMDTLEESMDEEGDEATIIGAVDITVLEDRDVLRHLSEAEEYLYISGMAVDPDYRRQGVATLLLEACVTRAIEWDFKYLVLHAYEDDFRARSLYSRAGYRIISADPAWMTKFLGRRRRVVMAKNIDNDPADNDADDDEVLHSSFT